jgi:hypothetical protein
MARRNNPIVTFLMFLGVCGFGYASYHYVIVEKIFASHEKPVPPDEEIARLRTLIEETMATDECFDHVTGFGWRPHSQRYRVDVEIRDGCSMEEAKRLATRVQSLVTRGTGGKHESEVGIIVLGRTLYISLP